MEPAKIDWKRIESSFVEDSVYEQINAPKWVDFLAPQDSINDEAWFCRPDCNHPKTAEDFLKTPPTSKLPMSASVNKILPFLDRNQRDAKLKRRELNQSSSMSNDNPTKFTEDSENQNPNLSTPPNYHAKTMKAAIKSSTERKKTMDDKLQNEETPRLKHTLSARNLFAGRDILGHITEFCNELKKLATRARERENEEKLNEKKSQMGEKNEVVGKEEASCDVLGELDGRAKERKPLLEVGKQKCEGMENASSKEKQRRKKRIDDVENIPISLNMDNVKHKGEERLMQIRTNPPSPQCFSVTRAPTKTTLSRAFRSKPMEREILQELEQNKEATKEEPAGKSRSVSIVDGREPRGLDVFWFLKPCTLTG